MSRTPAATSALIQASFRSVGTTVLMLWMPSRRPTSRTSMNSAMACSWGSSSRLRGAGRDANELTAERQSMAVAQNPWAQSLRRFTAFGDRVAVSSRGRTLTYAELVTRAHAVRAAVIEAGAQSGEVVAIIAHNGPGVVVASYGVMASGAAEFVVDLNLGPDDIAYAMRILQVR